MDFTSNFNRESVVGDEKYEWSEGGSNGPSLPSPITGSEDRTAKIDPSRIRPVLFSVRCSGQSIPMALYSLRKFFGDDVAGLELIREWITNAPYVGDEATREADEKDRKLFLDGDGRSRDQNGIPELETAWLETAVPTKLSSLERALAALGKLRDPMFNGSAIDWAQAKSLVNSEPDPNSHLNVRIAIRHLGATLYTDSFDHRQRIEGLYGHSILNSKALQTLWLRVRELGLLCSKDFFDVCALELASEISRHPVMEKLKELGPWDGTKRVHTLFTHYAGADEGDDYTELYEWAGRAAMIALIRRLRQPGVKFDLMPVLEGPQGAGKSTFLQILGGEWFEDGLQLGADPKIVIEQTTNKWVVEISELSGMSGREVENVKAMISRTHDTARGAYKADAETRPRQFLMFGTTNDRRYLKDSTGNRRFLPVAVGDIRLDELISDRDQLLAEALQVEAEGESIAMPPHLYAKAAALQESRTITSPVFDKLQEVIGDQVGTLDSLPSDASSETSTARETSSKSSTIGWPKKSDARWRS